MKTLTKNEKYALILDYLSNNVTVESFIQKMNLDIDQYQEIAEILIGAADRWELIECDDEGSSYEQDKELDKVIEDLDLELEIFTEY